MRRVVSYVLSGLAGLALASTAALAGGLTEADFPLPRQYDPEHGKNQPVAAGSGTPETGAAASPTPAPAAAGTEAAAPQ